MQTTVIPIVALLIPMIIVPTVLGLRHARYLREVEHKERMRAMELGRTLAEDESWTPVGLAAAIGVWVPLGAMVIAFISCERNAHSYAAAIWNAAGMVGLGGVVCGTFLAARHFATRQEPAPSYPDVQKPEYDPDAYDVVGRRG